MLARSTLFVAFFVTLIGCLLAGCAIGPNYSRPITAVAAHYKEAAPGWKTAQPKDHNIRGAWWEIFNDAQLNQLVARATLSNQTIARSAAAYKEARALVAQTKSNVFPSLGLTSSTTRNGSLGHGPSSFNGAGQTNSAAINTIYNASLEAKWEPDLWGKIQRQVSSQQASAQSAAADLANTLLSVQATLVQNYFQLRTLDTLQTLFNDTVTAYKKALTMTQHRYAQGAAARTEVLQAQTQLTATQAAALDNQLKRTILEHALATLVGESASTFSLASAPLQATPPEIPLQLPSALLERRPDIASAERQVAAANEKIGVALAGFFPSLSLSATGGLSSTAFAQWLSAPARVWALGPQLALTLFDAGLRRAHTDAARSAYEQSVAHYRQTVLSAFQEVEDQLATVRLLESEADIQQQTVASAQQALSLVTNEYKAGELPYFAVIASQATALSAQQNLANIAGLRMVAAAELIKALGGSWIASF